MAYNNQNYNGQQQGYPPQQQQSYPQQQQQQGYYPQGQQPQQQGYYPQGQQPQQQGYPQQQQPAGYYPEKGPDGSQEAPPYSTGGATPAPAVSGLTEGDKKTATRRANEKHQEKVCAGILCGGCFCVLCMGTEKAANCGTSILDFLLCMHCNCFGF